MGRGFWTLAPPPHCFLPIEVATATCLLDWRTSLWQVAGGTDSLLAFAGRRSEWETVSPISCTADRSSKWYTGLTSWRLLHTGRVGRKSVPPASWHLCWQCNQWMGLTLCWLLLHIEANRELVPCAACCLWVLQARGAGRDSVKSLHCLLDPDPGSERWWECLLTLPTLPQKPHQDS